MIKLHRDKRTGRTNNLLIRSREEQMTDDFVYEETKMIDIQKNYKLTLTEGQAQELYGLLKLQKGSGHLTTDHELVLVYNELKKLYPFRFGEEE